LWKTVTRFDRAKVAPWMALHGLKTAAGGAISLGAYRPRPAWERTQIPENPPTCRMRLSRLLACGAARLPEA
jgi:hypothetical protein